MPRRREESFYHMIREKILVIVQRAASYFLNSLEYKFTHVPNKSYSTEKIHSTKTKSLWHSFRTRVAKPRGSARKNEKTKM